MTEQLDLVDICVTRGDECDGTRREFLVVTNRKHGGFTAPGGKMDPGESKEKAALRELKEETGLEARPEHLLYVGEFRHRWRGIPVRCYGFVACIEDLEGQEPRMVEEGTKPFWVSRNDLLDPDGDCIAQSYYGWLMGKMHWDFEV